MFSALQIAYSATENPTENTDMREIWNLGLDNSHPETIAGISC